MAVFPSNETDVVESSRPDIVISHDPESTVIQSGGSSAVVESKTETAVVSEPQRTDIVLSNSIVKVENGTGTSSLSHLEVEFDFNDIGSPISLGPAPEDARVQNTFLEIIDPFDNGLQITIGTQVSLALLMRADENIPSSPGAYKASNNVKYDGRPEFFLFFNAASPMTGSARATIYFN